MNADSRIRTDTLRGLACLLLVAFHVVGHDGSTGLRLADDHLIARGNDWVGLLRMPLFSFLSGVVYAHRPVHDRIGLLLRGKTHRLLLPMLLVGTAFAVLQSLAPGVHGDGYDWHLLHVVPVAHYWFLESLFIIFVLVAVLERAGWLDSMGGLAAVWAVAGLLHLTAPLPIHFGLQGATYLLPFFLAGVAHQRFFHPAIDRPRVAASLGLVLVGVGLYWMVAAGADGPGALSPLTLAFSVCGCLLLSACRLRIRWLAWIGRWSFGIYLFHPVFTAASRDAFGHIGVGALPVLFASGLAAGVAGPIVLTAVLRRLPLGHLPLGERPTARRTRELEPAPQGGE